MSSPAQVTGSAPAQERHRVTPRILPKSLIYVGCGEANGGMVLNVSAAGMAVSMAMGVGDEAYSNLNVRMNGLPRSLEVRGRMVWTTASKRRAGIQLLDVNDEQREQIQEWIALDGVRDVNLVPRQIEAVAVPERIAVPIEDVAVAAVQEPVAKAVETERAPELRVPARSSLLDVFGGTAPETLGPPPAEQIARGEETPTSEPSRGFAAVDTAAFRDNEWDLASVTMVPRKRAATRPEGLSTFWLILLWVAIPSFGIGLLVGRRPLQQWLAANAFTGRRSAPIVGSVAAGSAVGASAVGEGAVVESADDKAREDAATELLSKQAAVEPTQIAEAQQLEIPAETKRTDTQAAGGVLPSDPSASIVDPRMLNSLSTQEARAFRKSGIKPSATDVDLTTGNSAAVARQKSYVGDANRVKTEDATPAAPSVAAEHKQPGGSSVAGGYNSNGAINGGSAATGTSVSASGPTVSTQRTAETSALPSAGSAAKANVAVTATAKNPALAIPPASNANGSNAGISNTSASGVAGSNATSAAVTVANGTSASGSTVAQGASAVTANKSVSTGVAVPNSVAPIFPPARSPGSNPVFENSGAGGSATMSVLPTPVRAVAPGGTLAPMPAQPPLHGTMLVARKNDQSFLFKFPVESVPGDSTVSMRMQRVVQVPAQSRWHGHGPIVKVKVGELLAEAPLDKPEVTAKPRVGDTVTVRALVNKDGGVENLKPVSGRFTLTPRVMRAVRNWQFDQTLIDGKAVESEVDITVQFH